MSHNLPQLAEQARLAYEQKRTKDCLDLTRTILLIDPDNTAAHWMRSSIQSEMHQDLESARAFLRDAQSRENAANASAPNDAPVSDPSGKVLPEEFHSPAPSSPVRPTFRRYSWLVGCVVFVLSFGAGSFARWRFGRNPFTPVAAGSLRIVDPPLPLTAPSGMSDPSVMDSFVAPVVSLFPASSALRLPANSPDGPAAPRANGTLAVSSPAAIDIYRDDTYIGSAPVSLDLPAGMQTLEYRHGNLTKKVTYVINSNETTRTAITFDVDVQVNSRPWAEVFVDGVERKDLGQTPLSGVRVPIGSVLVFENPKFAKKKYRVTGNETGVQNVFP